MRIFVTGDTQAPTQPGSFATTAITRTSIATGWSASSDNVGVAGYRLFLDGAQAGPPTQQTSFTFTGLVCGSTHTLGRRGLRPGRQHLRPARRSRRQRAPATRPRRRSRSPPRRPARPWRARSRSRRTRPTTTGSPASSSASTAPTSAPRTRPAPYAVSWDTRTVANGSHTLTAVARDRRRQHHHLGQRRRHRHQQRAAAGPRRRLRLRRGQRHGRPRRLRHRQQRHAHRRPDLGRRRQIRRRALLRRRQRPGHDRRRASLDLTTGMTLEAWVRPTVTRLAVADRGHQGAARAASSTRCTPTDQTKPQRQHLLRRRPSGSRAAPPRSPLNTWTHLATTYDGSNPPAVRQRRPGRDDHGVDAGRSPPRPARSGSAATRSGPRRLSRA